MDAAMDIAELEKALPPWTVALLDCLTVRRRQAFVLREAGGGLTFDEVGAQMGISNTAANQLYLAAAEVVTDAAHRGALLTQHVPQVVLHLQRERCVVPEEMRGSLELPIETLNLGRKAAKCFDGSGIRTVGDLVRKSEGELLKIPNIGRKTLKEIRKALAAIGLHLGMDVDVAVVAGDPTTPE